MELISDYGDMWGVVFMDVEGNYFPSEQPYFENALSFSQGYGAVKMDGQWWFVDEQVRRVGSQTYDFVGRFSEGYAAVKKDGLWGFVNKNMELKIPYAYDGVSSDGFKDGLAMVFMGNQMHYIDKAGKVVWGGKSAD